jgi:hypothetical protein
MWIALLISLNVGAVEILDGEFTYQGQASTSKYIETERVKVFTDEQKEYLTQLKANGYICELKTQMMYLCKRFTKTNYIPDGLYSKIVKSMPFLKLQAKNIGGKVDLISKGEALSEWLVVNPAWINGQQFDSYEIMEMENLTKYRFSQNGVEYWLNQNKQGELYHFMQVYAELSEQKSKRYIIEAKLSRIEN